MDHPFDASKMLWSPRSPRFSPLLSLGVLEFYILYLVLWSLWVKFCKMCLFFFCMWILWMSGFLFLLLKRLSFLHSVVFDFCQRWIDHLWVGLFLGSILFYWSIYSFTNYHSLDYYSFELSWSHVILVLLLCSPAFFPLAFLGFTDTF